MLNLLLFTGEKKCIPGQCSFTQKFLSPFACVRKCWEKNCLSLGNHFHYEREKGTLSSLEGRDTDFHGMFLTEKHRTQKIYKECYYFSYKGRENYFFMFCIPLRVFMYFVKSVLADQTFNQSKKHPRVISS